METNQSNDYEIEIDVAELVHGLLRKAWVIILVGMIAALLAAIGTKLFIKPEYRSTTKMVVLAKQNSDKITNSDLQTSTLLTKDYTELIKSRTVIEGVIARLGLDEDYEGMLGKMSVSTPTDTRMISISITDRDPYQAAMIADAIRDAAAAHIQSVMNTEAVNVADPANIPTKPYKPSAVKNGIIVGAAGVFIAIIIVIISIISNDTIKTTDDVEKYLGLSTLGSIPLTENEVKTKKKHVKQRANTKHKENSYEDSGRAPHKESGSSVKHIEAAGHGLHSESGSRTLKAENANYTQRGGDSHGDC